MFEALDAAIKSCAKMLVTGPPCSAADLAACEQRLGTSLPPELAHIYRTVGSFHADPARDAYVALLAIELIPLTELCYDGEELDPPHRYIVFGEGGSNGRWAYLAMDARNHVFIDRSLADLPPFEIASSLVELLTGRCLVARHVRALEKADELRHEQCPDDPEPADIPASPVNWNNRAGDGASAEARSGHTGDAVPIRETLERLDAVIQSHRSIWMKSKPCSEAALAECERALGKPIPPELAHIHRTHGQFSILLGGDELGMYSVEELPSSQCDGIDPERERPDRYLGFGDFNGDHGYAYEGAGSQPRIVLVDLESLEDEPIEVASSLVELLSSIDPLTRALEAQVRAGRAAQRAARARRKARGQA